MRGSVPDQHRRVPVLAAGSNRSPEQLLRKFPDDPEPVYAVRESLIGYDCVYSAHLTSYGAIPATFYPSPGTVVTTFVIWLTARQLDKMHLTEATGVNYQFGWMDVAYAYLSTRGPLLIEGVPIAVAAIDANRRKFNSLNEQGILTRLKEVVGFEGLLDDFVKQAVSDRDQRKVWTAEMSGNTGPWFPDYFMDEPGPAKLPAKQSDQNDDWL